ncbi:MAG: hypothetical protein WBI33_11680, partial [Bacteroidales bacterium]
MGGMWLISLGTLWGQCTATLTSDPETDAQTVCVNTAITDITYTTNATAASFINLPTGISGYISGNQITITGTPTTNGQFNYIINLSGVCGTATVPGTITVNPVLSVAVAVSASANPVCAGTSVTFTANPENEGNTPSYQWQVNGVNAGTNSPTYSYTPANGDEVTVILTSSETCASGSPATSNQVTMTVDPLLPVSVSIAASANPVCAGTSVTFTATPVNEGNTPSYQWQVNGVNAGTNSPTYSYTPADGDEVTVILTSSETCTSGSPATSESITIHHFAPLLPGTINTTTSQYCLGGTGAIGGNPPTYSLASGGSGYFTYTWQIDVGCTGTWTDIPGTNVPGYTPAPPATLGPTCYRRKVTDDFCSNEDFSGIKRFEIFPELVSQSIVPSPSNLTICAGTSISATFTDGSGGFPGAYIDRYYYSINGGASWDSYEPGNAISTTGLSGNNIVQIRTRREATGVDGCDYGEYITVSWSVNPLPAVSWTSLLANQCVNNTTYTLSGGLPAGGSYSGPGVTGTNFDASIAGIGTHTLTYTYSDINGCVGSTTNTIIVNDLPTATISYPASPYCATGTATVTRTGQEGGSYSSTPGLDLVAATGTINLATSTPGTYTVFYSFTNPVTGCSNLTSTPVTINPLPNATISYPAHPYCATGTAPVTLTGQTGGTFSGTSGLVINS